MPSHACGPNESPRKCNMCDTFVRAVKIETQPHPVTIFVCPRCDGPHKP